MGSLAGTTASLSLGANYALRRESYEEDFDPDSDLENLLAYTTPEISFRLPSFPQAEGVLRLHHRSGGRDYILRDLVNSDEAAGIQFLTIGVRWNF